MQKIRRIPYWGVLALLVYMPFHILLSQSLSLATGGLDYWKLGKDVVLLLLTVFSICMVFWENRAGRWYKGLLLMAIFYAALHAVVWLAHPDIYTQSALLGSIYNIRLVCFLLLGASATVLYPRVFVFSSLFKIVISVSSVVALLGVLQYFLPHDLLTHAGYSLARGVRPMFFIDDNAAFPRIMSTLRDPNSLGAYLIVPLSALTVFMLRLRQYATRQRIVIVLIWCVHLAALYLTFSRSAWAAACIAMTFVLCGQFSSQFVRLLRKHWWVAILGLALVIGGATMLKNNTKVDGVLTHSTAAQVGDIDSNQYHVLYVQRGLEGIHDRPLGHGPGTAGLASIQNPKGGLLTENYYVQIGYELGIFGLLVFVAINIWVYVCIWRRHDLWATVLLASFWGYVLMNMLLHTWSNEAVAAQWWLLAGVALSLGVIPATNKTHHIKETNVKVKK
jgi:hypothetical protein